MQRRRIAVAAAVVTAAGAAVAFTLPSMAGTSPSGRAAKPAAAEDVAPQLLSAMRRDLGVDADTARARVKRAEWAGKTSATLAAQTGGEYGGAWLAKDGVTLKVAVTDRGILVVASPDVDVIPLGTPLAEVAAGLLVPLGLDLVPRVAPDVLARNLGHGAGLYTVFPPSGAAFQIGDSALVPLERRALAKIEIGTAEVLDARVEPPAEPAVVNEPIGRFALWGFRAPGRPEP